MPTWPERLALGTGLFSTVLWGWGTGLGTTPGVVFSQSSKTTPGVVSRPVPSDGQLAGTVVDGAGQPVAGATLKLTSADTAAQATSGADGAFVLERVPEGRYALAASLDGYLATEYGAFQPGDPGVPIRVPSGQRVGNLTITLRKGGAIAGRVVDDHSEPITAHVSMLLPGPQGLRTVIAGPTDTAGRYRFSSLAPGSYAVLAVPDPTTRAYRVKDPTGVERPAILPPTFYPNVSSFASASLVTLGQDTEVSGIDVQLPPVPATNVEVAVTSAGGGRIGLLRAVMVADEERGPAKLLWAQNFDADAVARIDGVTAGQYRLIVTGQEQSPLSANAGNKTADELRLEVLDKLERPPEWAVRHIYVDGVTAQKIAVVLDPGARIEIRTTVVSNADVSPPRSGTSAARGWLLGLEPQPGAVPPSLASGAYHALVATPTGAVDASTIEGLIPGPYRVRLAVEPPAKLRILTVLVDGVDVLDQPFELTAGQRATLTLTLSDKITKLAGSITGPSGSPRSDVALVVFPRDSQFWRTGSSRIVVTRPDTSGDYDIEGLPPGDYLLAVVTERPPDDHADAQWLNSLQQGAIPITLADGQRLQQNLRTGR